MMQLLPLKCSNHVARGTTNFFVACFLFLFCFHPGSAFAQTVYYSKATGNLNSTATWGMNADGTGTSPADFASALQEFHISNGNAGSLSANWTVSGTASKIVVDGSNFTIPSSQTVTGTIDVNAGRTLTLQNPTLPTLGVLNATSTVVYSGLAFSGSFMVPTATTYGNIVFDNTTVDPASPTQTITFAGNFTLINGSSFVGADITSGYNLTTTGTANQTINANGLTLRVWNLSNNNTVGKTGTLTLAANTNMVIRNSVIMNCTGIANQFSDGGNNLTTYNDISMGGDAAGYNLTGTFTLALPTTGSVRLRGFAAGIASDAAPIAAALNNVTVATGGSVSVAFMPLLGGNITIKGNLSIAASGTGNVSFNSNTINLGGNLTHTPLTNMLDATGSTLRFNGTASQSYSSEVTAGNTLNNVVINNANGVALNSPLTVNGSLTLTNGVVNNGASTLTIGAAGTVTGASTASYVNGILSKTMPALGTTSMNYEVGDNTYAPVTITFSSSVSSGTVSVRANAGAHPQAASSLILPGNMVNHYWTVSATGVAPSQVNVALSYNSSDITGGGSSNTGYFIRKYSGGWATMPNVTNTTTATAPLLPFSSTSTGITGSSFSGDYIVGAPACNTINAGAATATPANLCVSGTSVISITAASSGPGITYQWQSSPDGATWTDISGETNSTYTTGTLTDTMYYRASIGCQLTGNLGVSSPATVIVNQVPPAISGSSTVCQGSALILTNAMAGGSWSSSNTSIATIGSSSGTVSAVGNGTVTITYASGACSVTKLITVNPLGAITGAMSLCQGTSTMLSNVATGGTWTSSADGIASIGSADGMLSGTNPGTATITYSLSTGCVAYATVTVNPMAPNTGTMTVCEGMTTTISNINTGGTWASGSTGVATVGTSGIVSGIAQGTANITYTAPGGCISVDVVTVNPLAQITGTMTVCEGLATTLNNVNAGGTWTSGSTSVATIGSSDGVVTGVIAGTADITYTLATGCAAMTTVTVNPRAAITGVFSVCEGAQTTLSNANAGGTWSTNDNTIATVGFSTGVVSGVQAGVAEIAYTLSTGCTSIASVLVNQAPGAIGGGNEVCVGSSVNLTNPIAGGAWSSSNAAIATVGLTTGVANGIAAGVVDITYALPAGCYVVMPLTVNALPEAITGASAVCNNQTITLTNATTGGTWSSGNTSVASVGSLTGVVTGMSTGNTDITYTIASGCYTTHAVTVNSLPESINGVPAVCVGSTTSLSDDTPGGTWTSSNTAVATTGTGGVISGVVAGTSTISYTLPTGCYAVQEVTVNQLPVVFNVTGGGSYCEGFGGVSIGLDNTEPGIRYELYNGSTSTGIILPGGGAALDFGSQTEAGTYTVLATNLNTGCKSNMSGSATVTVVAVTVPSVTFTGGVHDTVCSGVATAFTATPVNGGTAPVYTWSVNGIVTGSTSSTYTYTPTNGDVVDVTLTSNKQCAIPTTATATGTITVIPSQTPFVSIVASPGNLICAETIVTFTATAANSGSAPTFMWYRNGTTTGVLTSGTYTVVPADGDIIYTKVHSNYQCVTANDVPSNSIGMGVYPNYLPVVTISAKPGFYIARGERDTLTATVANGGPVTTYQWSKNGINIPGATNAVYIDTFSNGDSVACTVMAGGPCGRPSFNAVFMSVNALNLHPITSTGSDIALFPNPNTGAFTIKGMLNTGDNEEVSIEIMSMTGEMIFRKTVMVKNKEINEEVSVGNNLANGMYLLNVRSATENNVFHFMIQQ